MARERGSTATLETICVPTARAALIAGNATEHDRLVAEEVSRFAHCSAVILAHFSMANAAPRVQASAHCEVLAAPNCFLVREPRWAKRQRRRGRIAAAGLS